MLNKLLSVCLFCLIACDPFHNDADVSLHVTEPGYWYGRAHIHNERNEKNFDIGLKFTDEVDAMSPRNQLYFLRNMLDSNMGNKLKIWKQHFENKNISLDHMAYLYEEKEGINSQLKKYKNLFEKIQIFWGVKKRCHIHCFLSVSNSNSQYNGGWIGNFEHNNEIECCICLALPQTNQKRPTSEYVSIIAHEFSHAMCDAKFGREIFENIAKNVSSSAYIANWYLNEVLAILLGNCLVREILTRAPVKPADEEYCAMGFGDMLYPILKTYVYKRRHIDNEFIKLAVQVFEKLYPNAYKNFDVCLYKVCILHNSKIAQSEIMQELFKKTVVSSCFINELSQMNNDALSKLMNSNDTVIVIYNTLEELNKVRKKLPYLNELKTIEVIHQNKRTYVFIKVDKEHPWKESIDKLFSKEHGQLR